MSDADQELIDAARAARDNAYAPMSGYLVGAALRAPDGRVFAGANVEHAVLPLSVCAEHSAVLHGVSSGVRRFDTVAIVTSSSPPAAPCGSCRQILHAWHVDRVVLCNLEGEVRVMHLADLLPLAFSADDPGLRRALAERGAGS